MAITTRNQLENFHVNSADKVVALVTTRGEHLEETVFERHENQLRNEPVWAKMSGGGASWRTLKNTSESGWKMVNMLLGCYIDGQISKDDIIVV